MEQNRPIPQRRLSGLTVKRSGGEEARAAIGANDIYRLRDSGRYNATAHVPNAPSRPAAPGAGPGVPPGQRRGPSRPASSRAAAPPRLLRGARRRAARSRGPLRRRPPRREPPHLDAAAHRAPPSRRLALGQGRTPSSWPASSAPGATTWPSRSSRSSSPRRRPAAWSSWRRPASPPPSPSRRSRRTPPPGRLDEALPPYNAYSIDGDVTGDLVFVNYGVPADYEELARRGVDVRGKIVLARYGGSWRGIKPKLAAEHGAIGCIIYSDPREDGYTQGDPYPKGGWRPESGAQRGSVADMPTFPGDPLTPFVGATRDAKRLERAKAPTLTKIPVLPISWADALPLLQALGGPMAPPDWRGALPTPYHLGPGPARVRLQLAFDWKLVTAYDVIAKLQGSALSRPVGDPRQPPRRLGPRRDRSDQRHGGRDGRGARRRRARQERLAPRSGPSSTPAGTPKSPASSARSNGPRPTPTCCARRPSPTSTRTATPAASSRSAAPTRWRPSPTRWPAT